MSEQHTSFLFGQLGTVAALSAAVIAIAATAPCSADTIVITTNTHITDDDHETLDGHDVVVRGATLTIDGVHAFASLTVERNASNQPGVVTHTAGFVSREVAGVWLTIAGNVFVEGASGSLVASRIDLNGRGYPSEGGPAAGGSGFQAGGAGHGGAGGDATAGPPVGLGGGTYGDYAQPTTMGSGGGRDLNEGALGGAGGGVIRLTIAGTLTVDGSVTANGFDLTGVHAGGGAGGSIWIECAEFLGGGTITANGGTGHTQLSGGGGGGRIAIDTDASAFALVNLHAFGGNGWMPGGAGTIWFDSASFVRPVMKIDNDGLTGAVTEISGTQQIPGDVLVASGARVGPAREDPSFHLMIDGDVEVTSGASFYGDGRGHPSEGGPSAGGSGFQAGGAGHGGAGGDATAGPPVGLGSGTYGDYAQPTTMGSGGGRDLNEGALGGAGGGVIRLTIAGTLTVDGSVTANGFDLTGYHAGGGAGGSIWIECAEFLGSGTITANGGTGHTQLSGGGGGGRIAIDTDASTFALVNLHASGGNGWMPGGAGTIWFDSASFVRPVMKIDNDGLTGAVTEMSGTTAIPGDMLVGAGARVGPAREDPSFHLMIDGDVDVMAGASFFADGRGYPSEGGPGAGGSGFQAGGAGHGGAGGDATAGPPVGLGGGTYGDYAQPTTMGSGGGRDLNEGALGGAGGGVIRLTIAGTLTVDGAVTANGLDLTGVHAGGGAGGSIWIECAEFLGGGTITANGGTGHTQLSGGGGGGRIAITTTTLAMPFASIQARGGNGWAIRGGAGTCWLDVESASRPLLRVDNGGFTGMSTEISGVVQLYGDVEIAGGARFGPDEGDATLHLEIDGDVEVMPGAWIFADGRGYPSDGGPGAGGSGFQAGGGGHGGAGGDATAGPPVGQGGGTYGDFAQPTTLGSGGGRDLNEGALGGAGGGVIRMTVSGTLTVDGAVTSNGLDLTGVHAGGGAGGSLWIECGGLFGAGTIAANGGDGHSQLSGGGGGGRIAIYCCAVELPLANITASGGDGWEDGSVGSVGIFSDTITFTSLPQPLVLEKSRTALFSVSAIGDGPLAYQWFKDDEPLRDGPGVSGTTTPVLSLIDVTCLSDAGEYRARVTDHCGDAFTPAALLVIPIVGDVNGDCVIDGSDLAIVLGQWGACSGCIGDITGDGVVDGNDLVIVLGQWTG